MSEQLPSDLLSRLKRYAEQNAREPWIPVKAPELLALVESAEAAKAWRDATDANDEASKRRLLNSIRAVEAL
jgi:hypothetical protein